ncbi:MAG TPA: metalloregulator ArsR/SmtB family transcription factor [Egibacteraceae bacterium]|nr:metalloregulator ArsR/SmtB family transcription factor [Egibacteraceae bacterium]
MDATTFAALGEPSRLQIVELLRVGPFSVGDIAEELGLRQPQISKHLGVLRKAGVVDVEPVARRRIYHLRGEPFEEIGDWLHSFEELWEARLDSLETFLSSMEQSTQDDDL